MQVEGMVPGKYYKFPKNLSVPININWQLLSFPSLRSLADSRFFRKMAQVLILSSAICRLQVKSIS